MANSKKIETGVPPPAGFLPFNEDQQRQAKTRKFECVKKDGIAYMANRELLAMYGQKRIGRNVKARITHDCALHIRKPSVGLIITRCKGGYVLMREDSKLRNNVVS